MHAERVQAAASDGSGCKLPGDPDGAGDAAGVWLGEGDGDGELRLGSAVVPSHTVVVEVARRDVVGRAHEQGAIGAEHAMAPNSVSVGTRPAAGIDIQVDPSVDAQVPGVPEASVPTAMIRVPSDRKAGLWRVTANGRAALSTADQDLPSADVHRFIDVPAIPADRSPSTRGVHRCLLVG